MSLAGLPAGDDYLLVVNSTDELGGNATVTVNGGGTVLTPPATATSRAAGVVRDGGISQPPPAGRGGRRQTQTPPAVGTQRSFDLGAIGGGGAVPCTLRYVDSAVLMYVDNTTPAPGLGDTDLADLSNMFGNQIEPRDVQLFGDPPDVDNNGRVILLFTPTINSRAAGGVTRGYGAVYPGDLLPSGNHADLLYLFVPTTAAGMDFASRRQAYLSTMAHEFQHLINYGWKIVRHNTSPEESWLSEALSFNAEQLNGYPDTPGGPPGNVLSWLTSPESYTLMETSGSYLHGEVGASFLFVRYLIDLYGEAVLKKLATSDQIGTSNVTAQTGVAFATLATNWALAAALNGSGLTTDSRYAIPGFDTHATYSVGTLTGPATTAVDGSSGRPGFSFSFARGGVRYLRLHSPAAAGVTLAVTADAGDQVRVSVVRVPATFGS